MNCANKGFFRIYEQDLTNYGHLASDAKKIARFVIPFLTYYHPEGKVWGIDLDLIRLQSSGYVYVSITKLYADIVNNKV